MLPSTVRHLDFVPALLAGIAAAALAGAPLGCAIFEDDGQNGEPAIRTDRQEYALRLEGETIAVSIGMTYTNHSGRATHLLTCNGAFSMILEKFVAGRWVQAYGSVSPDCLGPVITIPPARQHAHALEVIAFQPSSTNDPKFQVEPVAGTYRVVWPLSEKLNSQYDARSGWGTLLPLEQRVSNNFEIMN